MRLRLLGDVVFTTPLPRAIKRAFPDARVSYLVEPPAAPVVAGNPSIDEVIVAPRTRGVRRLLDDVSLAARLRRERFDLAIDLHGGPRSAWLTRASGARERIGYDIPGRTWMYTRVVHRPRALRPRHSVENQWDLLRAIPGWPQPSPDPSADPVEMHLDEAVDRRVAERLLQAGVAAGDDVIVIHVSAGNPFRRWPESAFVELVERLARGGRNRRLILSSGPSDRAAADRVASAARARLAAEANRVLEFGEIDIPELRALVGRSRLFIGGDTGPLHVAATTATPIVGIYGPTLSARSAPWRDPASRTVSVELPDLGCRPCDQRACAPGDFRCLTGLPASAVIAAAERILA